MLLHGFPDVWYSWRHQMRALAEAGYHAVAPDMRGYGSTDAPLGVQNYTGLQIVADIVGLIDALGQEKVLVVAHDWGANIAWYLCLCHPERVKGVAILSVHFKRRKNSCSPLQMYRASLPEGFYVLRFQEPGRAEADFSRFPVKDVLKAAYMTEQLVIAPPDKELMDVMAVPKSLPPWITEEYFDYSAEQFKKSGFTGPLNYYRAMDLTWEEMAPWTDKGIDVPTLFIIGDRDLLYKAPGAKEYIHGGEFVKDVQNLKDIVVLSGGHFIQQEAPLQVNDHILKFFDSMCRSPQLPNNHINSPVSLKDQSSNGECTHKIQPTLPELLNNKGDHQPSVVGLIDAEKLHVRQVNGKEFV